MKVSSLMIASLASDLGAAAADLCAAKLRLVARVDAEQPRADRAEPTLRGDRGPRRVAETRVSARAVGARLKRPR